MSPQRSLSALPALPIQSATVTQQVHSRNQIDSWCASSKGVWDDESSKCEQCPFWPANVVVVNQNPRFMIQRPPEALICKEESTSRRRPVQLDDVNGDAMRWMRQRSARGGGFAEGEVWAVRIRERANSHRMSPQRRFEGATLAGRYEARAALHTLSRPKAIYRRYIWISIFRHKRLWCRSGRPAGALIRWVRYPLYLAAAPFDRADAWVRPSPGSPPPGPCQGSGG